MNKKNKSRTSGGGGMTVRERPGSSSGSLTRGDRSGPPASNVGKQDQRNSPSCEEEGIFKENPRVTYICSSLIGSTINVELDDGIVYEGVFRTFSTDLDIVLDQCHQVDPEDPTKIDPATVKITGVFNMKRIIRCSAFDVDLNHAKDGFMTDTQISGTNRLNGERTLEEWIPDADEEHGVSLELEENDANGWRAEDMFKANEENYGVQTTFKSNLEGYTTQISTEKNTEEYRKLEAQAAKAAQEIEGSGTNKLAIELENGDEEEAFSAVVRGKGGDDSGKYVAPARRQPQGNVAPNNRNTSQQPQNQQQANQRGHQQQVSPASSMSRGRRDYPGQGNSPATTGGQASAHSGRDQQQYHDEHVRGGGGPPRGGRGGGNFNREPNRGPGGRPEKVASDLRQFSKDFNLVGDQNQQRGGHPYEKQPSPKLASPSAGGPGPNQQQGPGARGSPHGQQQQKGSSPPTAAEVAGQHQRRTSPPTASIITRQDSAEQQQQQRRTPTPAKSPPMATPTVATPMPPTGVPVSIPPVPAAAAANIVTKSKLNPNAKEFVLNPKAKEFIPPTPRPPVGATPPPARPMTPATPTGINIVPGMPGAGYPYPGHAAVNIPFSQGNATFPYIAGSVPNAAGGASTYIYAPTSQPPPPQYQPAQPRFRAAAPVTSAREATSQVIAGQPLLSPQNTANIALIPPMPHMQQQHIPGAMVPVSGAPPVMVRPVDSAGNPSLPPNTGGWSLQPQPNQPAPHQMGGPPPHPPSAGTPNSNLGQPQQGGPPTSATPPTLQQPPVNNHGNPQSGGHAPHGLPHQMHPNGGVAVSSPNVYANFIPGSMQPQSLPHQYPAFHQLLLQPGQTAAAHAHHAALLQQPIMSQAQPVTSIAGGLQQFPYPVHQSHGVVPGQQNSPQPQFIIQPHGMPMAAVQTVGQAGGQGTPVGGAPGVGGQMQGPPGGPGQ